MTTTAKAVLVGAICALSLMAGCGSEESGGTTELTPEQVRENLIDDGYEVGEILTEGANEGVVNGRDADAYLSVDYTPEGVRIYSSVYFLGSEQLANALWKRLSESNNEDGDGATEIRETRVYNISGSAEDLSAVVAAAEE